MEGARWWFAYLFMLAGWPFSTTTGFISDDFFIAASAVKLINGRFLMSGLTASLLQYVGFGIEAIGNRVHTTATRPIVEQSKTTMERLSGL